jgi:hypothetical protein
MGSPRLDVVFCFWQCDKKNHGWREGPPVTVLCQSFRSAGRAFTLRLNQIQTKKEYSFAPLPASIPLEHWPVMADNAPGAANALPRVAVRWFFSSNCWFPLTVFRETGGGS